MRCLHVTHQYRPAIGGSENYMADLSEELVQRGHSVDVVTSRAINVRTWKTELPAFEKLNGVNVYRFRSLKRYRHTWHILKLGNFLRHRFGNSWYEPLILFGNGPVVPGLAWYILRYGRQYDLIHIQTIPYFHFVYAYLCAQAVGMPIIVTPHIHVEQEQTFDLKTFNAVLRNSNMVITVSEREVPYLTARGVAPGKILITGNGVKLNELPIRDMLECRMRLGIPEDAFVLLFLGRKVPYKGLQMILAAFEKLQAHYPSLYLVSAGPATEHSLYLNRQYSELPRWIDLDMVTNTEKIDLLNACDVLLLPSTGEAFGIVFLEAWAVGKPVIGARAGAIPFVISEGRDGLLVTPGDATELAQKIESLITQPELRNQLAINGQNKVYQRYTIDRIADQIETGYQCVVEGRHARSVSL